MPLQPCGGHDMNTPDGMFAYGFCQTGVSAAVSKVLIALVNKQVQNFEYARTQRCNNNNKRICIVP